MKMTLLHATLKIIVCSLVMLGCVGRGHAADPSTEQEGRFLNPRRSMTDLQPVKKFNLTEEPLMPLQSNIEPVLKTLNVTTLHRNCEKELNDLRHQAGIPLSPFKNPLRLYCLINFSSAPVTLAKTLKKDALLPGTCSVFASCYEGPILFKAGNTLFLHLMGEDYPDSKHKYLIHEEIRPDKFAFCYALVLRDASLVEAESAKTHLLGRYAQYAVEPDYLHERQKAFPGLSEYLEDPQAYAKKIESQKVVFTYDEGYLKLPPLNILSLVIN